MSLSKTEMNRVGALFGANGDTNQIDFVRMSKELSLHSNSLNYVGQRANKVETLKEMMNRSGMTDYR